MKHLFWTLLLAWVTPTLAFDLYYLKPDSVDLSSIAVAPTRDSATDKQDLQTVLEWQNKRTTAECDRARSEEEAASTVIYAAPYGPLSHEQAKTLLVMHERLFDEVNYFAKILKQRYQRPRPFMNHREVKPCVATLQSYSFPSGHAATGRLTALAFARIFPEQAEALKLRGEQLGLDRIIGGVHYPSDVEAGRAVAELVWQALLKEPRFLDDLEALRPH